MLRLLSTLFCMILACNGMAQVNKNTEIDYKQTGAPMPSFLLVSVYDSNYYKSSGKKNDDAKMSTPAPTPKYFTDKDVNNGANLFVMMFNPTCSHCEGVAKMLEKNLSLFKQTKIVFMAKSIMQPYLPDFIHSYHIDRHPNEMYIGTDSTGFIDKTFLYTALPQINIYNGERKLLKIYTGELELDSLKQYIQ